jgi:hypothetical protein
MSKYLGDQDHFSLGVPTRGSQFRNSIQEAEVVFQDGAKHQVHDGNITYFWMDWWTGVGPLRVSFPHPFECCDNPFAMVAAVRSAKGWHIRFRRAFGLAETVEWDNLCRVLTSILLVMGETKYHGGSRPQGSTL